MYAIRMMLRGKHPVHGLPFDGSILHRLGEEWRAMPFFRRARRLRKALQRDLGMLASGQARLCVERAPPGVRRVLWVYNWTTLGDSIMDLAARFSIPEGIEVDLCITPALADLFTGDSRFARVLTSLDEADAAYDFVLIHELMSATLKEKRQRMGAVPFAAILNYAIGEHFARTQFVDARIRHLFGLAAAPAPRPYLPLGPSDTSARSTFDVVVALGARDPRRRFPHWGAALDALLLLWPSSRPRLRFILLGNEDARGDTLDFSEAVRRQSTDRIGRTPLLEAARTIRDSDAFLGADGGLMHIAAAADRPGLALFTAIDPSMRLPADAALQALVAEPTMAQLPAAQVAAAFVAACS